MFIIYLCIYLYIHRKVTHQDIILPAQLLRKNRATLGSILSVSQSIVLELIEREYVKMREFDFFKYAKYEKKVIKYRSVKNYQL